MAGNSHIDSCGDVERDGKIVETHSRLASSEEEQSSHPPSNPGPSDAPARRSSLPTPLYTSQDSFVAPVPEHNQRPHDTVLPFRMMTPQSHSRYRSCPHRTHECRGGPPCYLCSVLDMPPKYRRKEAQGWHRFKEKLVQLSHTVLSPPPRGRVQEQDPPADVFTVSEWRPRNTPRAAPATEVPASHNAVTDHNPAFNAQDPLGGVEARGGSWVAAPQLPSTSVVINGGGEPSLLLSPFHPSSDFGQTSPPPYSPSSDTNVPMSPIVPPRNARHAARANISIKRLLCQLLYAVLLAAASSTLIISYDQPIIVVTSVIVFMTLFVFLPLIAILECLFRCKMEQDFQQYLQNILSSSSTPSTHFIL